jgi:TPR repeat protein
MQAAHWYRLSAQQGYAPAQNRLGVCYAIGIGVGKDYTEAVRWYRLSADQGNAIAQNNLGGCYYKGHGVAQDYAESERWYRKAAAQGNLAAQRNLSFYFERGSGGAGTPISQTVQDKATAPSQPSLTVDEIKEQGSQGFKADSIVANIKETNSKFSPQDIAAAEQADPPLDAEVIKCMKDNLR